MSDEKENRHKSAPTENMLAAAKRAAQRHGIELPASAETDFDTCRAFLDEYLSKPSPKAMAYALRIAEEKGLTIPADARTNAKELSAWIDANN